MTNSLFYKVLALISTIGIIVLSGNAVFKSISESTDTVEESSKGKVWLILHKGWAETAALEKIEMKDMDQCELQAAIWKAGKRIEKNTVAKYMGYECLEGK